MADGDETHGILRENIIEAQEQQTKYSGGKQLTFVVGDKVWLSTRNLNTSRPSKKLDCKHTAPYMVTEIINQNCYKLALLSTMRNHNVSHVSLLDHYTSPVGDQPSSKPHPMIVEHIEEWNVDRILDSQRRYRKRHYVFQWAGYNHIRTGWEPAEHLKNARLDLVDKCQ